MLEHEVDNGLRVLEAMGMMVATGLSDELKMATEFLIALLGDGGVFGQGHDLVCITANGEDGNLVGGQGSEVVDGVELVGLGFFIGLEAIHILAAGPVAGGALAFAKARGPALEVAHRGIHIQAGHHFGMRSGEVVGEQAAAAESLERDLGIEVELFHHMIVKHDHVRHGSGAAVLVGHIGVGNVETFLQKAQISLGLVSKELRAPNPGIARSRLLGHNEEAFLTTDHELGFGVAVPLDRALSREEGGGAKANSYDKAVDHMKKF